MKYTFEKTLSPDVLNILFAFNMSLLCSKSSTVNLRGLLLITPSSVIALRPYLISLLTLISPGSKSILFCIRLCNSRSSSFLLFRSDFLLSGSGMTIYRKERSFREGTFLSRKEHFSYERKVLFELFMLTGRNWEHNAFRC